MQPRFAISTVTRTNSPSQARYIAISAACAAAGWLVAVFAWGDERWPGASIVVPLVWIWLPWRLHAALFGTFYCLGTVRFVPHMAGVWYGSLTIGVGLWAGVGLASMAMFSILWTESRASFRVILSCWGLLLSWLILGVVIPGHPLFGWGYPFERSGWLGVALHFVLLSGAAMTLRSICVLSLRQYLPFSVLILLCLIFAITGGRSSQNGSVEHAVALQTQWGAYPKPFSTESHDRVKKIGSYLDGQTYQAVTAFIFPESILGLYDLSLEELLASELSHRVGSDVQLVVVGADVSIGLGELANAALIIGPYGRRQMVFARQSTPIAQWRPWSVYGHFPSDWLRSTVVDLAVAGKVRLVFCHEEYSGALSLISEALDEPHVGVISLVNLWAATDTLPNAVQSAHTEGIARLFGKSWARSVNAAACMDDDKSGGRCVPRSD